MWGHKQLEWKGMPTRENTNTMSCYALPLTLGPTSSYAPHVGRKDKQNLWSNCVPINTHAMSKGNTPNFWERKEAYIKEKFTKLSLIFIL